MSRNNHDGLLLELRLMRDKISKKFLEVMAKRFSVLADPARLAIIHCPMINAEQNVSQIVEVTQQSHSNVSKHLRHLRESGLVSRRTVGLQVFYRLEDPLVEKLCKLVCESLYEEFKQEQYIAQSLGCLG